MSIRVAAAQDGLAVRVRDGGDDAVLWIHGYTMDGTVWAPLWDLLPGRRHVAVDLPGHGRSRPVLPGEQLAALAEVLTGIARRWECRHLVGLSFGGMVALQMAIDAAPAFDTVTLCSPAVGGGPRDPACRARHADLARLYRDRGPGPWMTDLWMSSPPDIFRGAARYPQVWRRLQDVVGRHSWAELGDPRLGGLFTAPGQLRALPRVTAGTLVLVGEEDMPSFLRSAELLRARIPRCRLMRCAGGGHLSLLERPAAFAPHVSAHLAQATGGAGQPPPSSNQCRVRSNG